MRALRFAGYAALFDVADRGGDVIRAGAFREASRAVPLLRQHDPRRRIGQIELLAEDARGLRVIGRVTDPATATLVAEGALDGLSIGYRAVHAKFRTDRELLRLDLVEVSLVTKPMQPRARVHAVELLEEERACTR